MFTLTWVVLGGWWVVGGWWWDGRGGICLAWMDGRQEGSHQSEPLPSDKSDLAAAVMYCVDAGESISCWRKHTTVT